MAVSERRLIKERFILYNVQAFTEFLLIIKNGQFQEIRLCQYTRIKTRRAVNMISDRIIESIGVKTFEVVQNILQSKGEQKIGIIIDQKSQKQFWIDLKRI